MVTQTETRAIKASENKSSKTFQRKLTALYTPATLEVRVQWSLCCSAVHTVLALEIPYILQAGETIGQADSQDGSQGYDTWSNERLSQWLVAVVEAPSAGAGAARGAVELGVVAVETSTGAVQYSQFRQASCLSPACEARSMLCWVRQLESISIDADPLVLLAGTALWSHRRCIGSVFSFLASVRRDGTMRTELEALLLYAAPRELLIVEPLSSATSKMLGAFVSASAGVRAETVQRDAYRDGGARAAVVAFYGEEGAPSAPQPVCASRVPCNPVWLEPSHVSARKALRHLRCSQCGFAASQPYAGPWLPHGMVEACSRCKALIMCLQARAERLAQVPPMQSRSFQGWCCKRWLMR